MPRRWRGALVARSPAGQDETADTARAGYLPGEGLCRGFSLVGWLLFAVALGIGLLIGWSIWGQ